MNIFFLQYFVTIPNILSVEAWFLYWKKKKKTISFLVVCEQNFSFFEYGNGAWVKHIFVLKDLYLISHLLQSQAASWRRLVGECPAAAVRWWSLKPSRGPWVGPRLNRTALMEATADILWSPLQLHQQWSDSYP